MCRVYKCLSFTFPFQYTSSVQLLIVPNVDFIGKITSFHCMLDEKVFNLLCIVFYLFTLLHITLIEVAARLAAVQYAHPVFPPNYISSHKVTNVVLSNILHPNT